MIDSVARAFGEGCDARIEGRAITTNPYRSLSEPSEYAAWRSGWLDVHRFFGQFAYGKFAFRKIPPAQGWEESRPELAGKET